MADVKVQTATLQLTTVKLSKAILKQMPRLTYDKVRALLKDAQAATEQFKDGTVVGWIHGSVFGNDRGHDRYLLLKTAEGEYGLYDCLHSTIDKVGAKQIYVA